MRIKFPHVAGHYPDAEALRNPRLESLTRQLGSLTTRRARHASLEHVKGIVIPYVDTAAAVLGKKGQSIIDINRGIEALRRERVAHYALGVRLQANRLHSDLHPILTIEHLHAQADMQGLRPARSVGTEPLSHAGVVQLSHWAIRQELNKELPFVELPDMALDDVLSWHSPHSRQMLSNETRTEA